MRIDDHSEEVIAEMKRKVEEALNALGETAAARAADVAPVDTGRLKNSITYATKDYMGKKTYMDDEGNVWNDGAAKNKPDDTAVYIGTNVPYAKYQEFGTSKGVRAKHFIEYGANATFGDYAKQFLESVLKGD